MNQRMVTLPEICVKELVPFEESGADRMGHFLVKMNGRADHKVWISVFVLGDAVSPRRTHLQFGR